MTEYRLLLSCASSMVSDALFEPGLFDCSEAEERAAYLRPRLGGVEVYVVPDGTDPREVLARHGW